MTKPLRLVQLGCGANFLDGWENYDREVDLSQRLPFESASIDRIFLEHTIEHLTQLQGIDLLREIKRVLCPGGGLRVSFPTPPMGTFSNNYRRFCAAQTGKGQSASDGMCISMMFFHFGHLSQWNRQLMCDVLRSLGFDRLSEPFYSESGDRCFQSVDRRHLHVGLDIAKEETGIVEGWIL